MATTLPYTVRCPMCEYSDTWVVRTSDDPYEGVLPVWKKRTFVKELVAEHPNHPKPRSWPDVSLVSVDPAREPGHSEQAC